MLIKMDSLLWRSSTVYVLCLIEHTASKFAYESGLILKRQLGAFGFLSSDEVMRYGAVNAGLLDQNFALQWVQSYIGLFGGNASQVTISGESAGGGSVMLQVMAFGGYLGDSLFSNVGAPLRNETDVESNPCQAIAQSPYLPMQYGYADFVPSQTYYAFASALGCFGPPALPQGNSSTSIFQCLLTQSTETLQNASATISGSSKYGAWAFLPVTDGVFIQQLPSQQLLKKQVNGNRILVGVCSHSYMRCSLTVCRMMPMKVQRSPPRL